MATEKAGIELELTTNAEKALRAAGMAARETRTRLAQLGTGAASAFDAVGKTAVFMNQALELGKKGLEVFRSTIGASIERSLEFRAVGDDTLAFFKDMARESDLVKARIGDALLPVIQGFGEALGETTGKVSDLIAANQKLIGSKLVEWLGATAKALVSGVAKAAEFVGKIFFGWKAIINVVQIAINEFLALAVRKLDTFAGAIGWVAEKLGAKGLSQGIASARESLRGLADEFERSSAAAQDGLADNAAAINTLEKTIEKLEGTAQRVIGDGMVQAQKRVAEATIGTTNTIAEQTEEIAKQLAAVEAAQKKIDELSAKRIAAIDAEADAQEAKAKTQDAAMQAQGPGLGEQAAGAAAGAVGGAAGSIASGFASGGPGGALVAGIGAAIGESEALQKAFAKINKVFSTLIKAIDPLLLALNPLIDILLGALQPALEAVGKVAGAVGKFILRIFMTLAQFWNGIVDAIAGLLRTLGDISIFGKRPLGFLRDWGDDLHDAASINTRGMRDAMNGMQDNAESVSETMGEGADVIADTVQEMQRELFNVPNAVKIAFREFNAADQDRPVQPFTYPDVGSAPAGPNQAVGGNAIIVTTMNVESSKMTTDEIVAKVTTEANRVGYTQAGAMSLSRGVRLMG